MICAHPAHAEVLPWLDQAVPDPFKSQEKVEHLVSPNLKPDSCGALPDFKRALNFIEVVSATLCHNPGTRAAYLTLLAQGDTYVSGYSAYLPAAAATYSATRMTTFQPGGKFTDMPKSDSITLGMTIYDFGQRELKLESAELALAAAAHSYDSTLQGAIASALQAYFNVLAAQDAMVVAQQLQQFAKESLDAATLRHDIGQVPLADVLEAKGSYSTQELSVLQAQNNLALSQAALAQLMGQSADTELSVENVDEAALNREPFADTVRALMDRAKEKRPDVQAGRSSLQSSEVALQSQKRADLATVSATANVGLSNDGNANWYRGGNTRTNAIGLSVSIPIFTGFLNSYNERASEKLIEAQKATLEETELQVEQDVWGSWHNFQTAKQSWVTSKDQLQSATQLRDVALGRYKEGLGTILDVLNAQVQYSNALESDLQSRYNLFTSRVDLVRAVGMLDLNNIAPAPIPPLAAQPVTLKGP